MIERLGRTDTLRLTAIATSAWIAVYIVFRIFRFDVLISDVAWYLYDAEILRTSPGVSGLFLTLPTHVPGYPVLLALIQPLTSVVPVDLLLQVVAATLWIIASVLIHRIVEYLHLPQPWIPTALFLLFPFAGVTEVVYPRADPLLIVCVVGALYAYLTHRRIWLVMLLIAASFVHKFAWPIVGMFLLVGLIQRRVTLVQAIVTVLPLLAFFVIGSQVHDGDLLWSIRGNVQEGIRDDRVLPIFDGLLYGLFDRTLPNLLQTVVLIAAFALFVVLLIDRSWQREPILLAILVPFVLWAAIGNDEQIWAIMRFGKLTVIPLWLMFDRRGWIVWWSERLPTLIGVVLGVGFVTQIAFAYYMVRYFA